MAEMTTTIYDLTVIGAGPGGYEAALEAAKLGLRTALIEKDSLGGTCLNRGCIPTKTLLHSSELYKEICNAERFGVSAEHVQADLIKIQQHKQTTITTLQKGIAALLKAAKVTIYQGLGTVIHTGTDASGTEGIKQVQITSDGADPVIIETRQILLASGSIPSVPPIPGHDLPGVMTSDELLSWNQEPFSSLLIIGGGVIGVEFAGIWQALGTKVTILEALPSLIANMDKELGQSLKQFPEQHRYRREQDQGQGYLYVRQHCWMYHLIMLLQSDGQHEFLVQWQHVPAAVFHLHRRWHKYREGWSENVRLSGYGHVPWKEQDHQRTAHLYKAFGR